MANLRLLKKRVLSIKNIGKITRALEMVSASKVQRTQDKALKAKPYSQIIYELVSLLASNTKQEEVPLMRDPKVVKADLYILISTNRGLVGSLNNNLFKFVGKNLKESQGIEHYFITVGKKGRYFAVKNGKLLADFSETKDFQALVGSLVKLISDGFIKEEFDSVYVVYSDFINILIQKPRVKRILPVTNLLLEKEKKRDHFEIIGDYQENKEIIKEKVVYYFEPDPVSVLNSLLPFYLEIQIAESFYESEASENSARMVAMKNATENSRELSGLLSLEYNKERQSMITTEISDITTAQLSLKN